MSIKLAGFDLDGTMLSHNGGVTPYTYDVLLKAKQKRVHLVPVTGRAMCETKSVLPQLPVRYLVAVNGTVIYDLESNEIIYKVLPNQEKLLEKLKIALTLDAYIEVYCGEIYTSNYYYDNMEKLGMRPHLLEIIKGTRTVVPDLYSEIEKRKQAEKINIWFRDDEHKSKYQHLFKDEEYFSHTSAFPGALEVGVKNMDKGMGISMIADILGVSKKETMAIGDASNDIPMLKWAGLGVAMGNATEEIKKIADVVALSNDDDGAAKVIEKYVLYKD